MSLFSYMAAMVYEAFARVIVEDGSASALLLLDGELVWNLLELTSRCWFLQFALAWSLLQIIMILNFKIFTYF